MRLIVRGDDFGYSHGFNMGYVDAIRHGIMTSAELMIGMPGTLEAVMLLKEFPWMPVGWHVHVCGRPSANPNQVSSLLDEWGNLKLHISRGHPKDESIYEELYIEMKAELDTFIRLTGKLPDTISNVDDQQDPYSCILRKLATDYHINHLFRDTKAGTTSYRKWICIHGEWHTEELPVSIIPTKQKWSELDQMRDYHPENTLMRDHNELLSQKEGVALAVFHPGYMDQYLMETSTCNVARVIDQSMLTDPAVYWHLQEMGVELITSNDYFFGTNDYQNYRLSERRNEG